MDILNNCEVFSQDQLREALGITRQGWARFSKKHGLQRPKIGTTSYYTKAEIHDFFVSFNQDESLPPGESLPSNGETK